MKVVEESQGQRTVLVTLYNDSAAKLADATDRTVELRFYSDSEHSQPARVSLKGTQSGVTSSGNTITLP